MKRNELIILTKEALGLDTKVAAEGFIRACAPVHAGFMGGGGNQEKFKHETGPAIAEMFKNEDVDAVILTAG